jgi:N-acetylglucosamine kinase-like BadF-type ATPase
MMMSYFLGIDIGATKSHALIANQAGKAVGFGSAGPGNHEVVGWDGHREVLETITQQALESAGIERSEIRGAGFGMAGYDWPSQRQPTLEAIASLGLACSFEAVNDAVLGIFAGTSEGWGISIIAGTGENCWGVDRERNYGRMTGNSMLMDEYGGAATIVYKAVRTIARAWSLRGPQTALAEAFMEHTGASSPADLLEGLVTGCYELDADIAPLVFEVAEAGDPAAVEVLWWAGDGLGQMVNGVIHQLSFEEQEFEVIMAGSTFKGGDLLIKPMKETVLQLAPGAKFLRLAASPVVGGVLLGMEQAGVNGYVHRSRLIESAQALNSIGIETR